MKKLLCVIAALSIILTLSSCKESGSKVITYETEALPDSVDPLIASNDTELTILYNIFEPLLLLESDGSFSCGAAESYSLSDDKLTLSFTLRKDAKWSDGEAVNGADFAFNLKRAVDPSTRFAGSTALSSIKNAKAIMSSEQSPEALGISYDDGSLTVYLEREDSEILYAFAGPAGMPCRENSFDAAGGKYCMTKDTTISNGPFALSRWVKSQGEETAKFINNKYYSGPRATNLGGVYIPLKKADGRLDRLKNGNIDCGTIDSSEVSSAGEKNQLLSDYCSSVVMALSSAEGTAFADDTIRKALYLSTDRDNIQNALPEFYEKAGDIVSPDSVCCGKLWRKDSPLTLPENTDGQFSDVFSSAKTGLSEKKVTSLSIAYETDEQKSVVNYTAQNWQKLFGIRVDTVKSTRSQIIKGIKDGSFAAGLISFNIDGSSAYSTLLKLCAEGGGIVTDEGYTEAVYSSNKTLESLEAAESSLVEKCLVLPMYYGKKYYVFSSDVSGQSLFPYSGTVDFTKADLL